jgi:hypothetical protein
MIGYRGGENYPPNEGEVAPREIDVFISVFVVDRRTGKQAKLYESAHVEVFQILRIRKVCSSLAVLQWATRCYCLPVPSTYGCIWCACKDEEFGDPNNRAFELKFAHMY